MDRRNFAKGLFALPFIGKTLVAKEKQPEPKHIPITTTECKETIEQECQCCYCKDMKNDLISGVITDVVGIQDCDAIAINIDAITQVIPGTSIPPQDWQQKYAVKIEGTG